VELTYLIYLIIIVLACIIALFRIKFVNKADGYILFLLNLTFISESIGKFLTIKYHDNTIVYQIFSPLEFFLIASYYNECIPFLKRNYIGRIVGIIGLLFAIFNMVFWQPINTYNSNFFVFEGLLVLILSLFSYFPLLIKEEISVLTYTQFWITTLFLFLWAFNFLRLTIIQSIHNEIFHKNFQIVAIAITYLTYVGFGLVFYYYPKLIRSGE
jgi:hypothetical protein